MYEELVEFWDGYDRIWLIELQDFPECCATKVVTKMGEGLDNSQ
jgi:hypothetical protein